MFPVILRWVSPGFSPGLGRMTSCQCDSAGRELCSLCLRQAARAGAQTLALQDRCFVSASESLAKQSKAWVRALPPLRVLNGAFVTTSALRPADRGAGRNELPSCPLTPVTHGKCVTRNRLFLNGSTSLGTVTFWVENRASGKPTSAAPRLSSPGATPQLYWLEKLLRHRGYFFASS